MWNLGYLGSKKWRFILANYNFQQPYINQTSPIRDFHQTHVGFRSYELKFVFSGPIRQVFGLIFMLTHIRQSTGSGSTAWLRKKQFSLAAHWVCAFKGRLYDINEIYCPKQHFMCWHWCLNFKLTADIWGDIPKNVGRSRPVRPYFFACFICSKRHKEHRHSTWELKLSF